MSVSKVTEDTFPPHSWLGFGLDMTTVMPSDITSVTESVLKVTRVIQLSTDGTQETFNGVTWTVPDGVDVAEDIAKGEASYNTYSDGTTAASSIEGNASLSAKYMAVSGDVSASYSISKMFEASYSYALFSYNQSLLQVSFEDWGSKINQSAIKTRLNNIPKFNPQNDDVVGQYKRLFKTLGSHIITGANYGGRFQLNVWASNSDSTVKENFSTDVSAAYNGVTASGKFDASIKTTSEYSTFMKSMQKTCSCQGGDPKIAGFLAANPSDDGVYKAFESWVDTSRTLPGVMSMQIMTLWDIMSAATDPDVYNRAADVQNAYQWIAEHPAVHETKCRFVINSDWGEIGLLTPSAFIIPDPDSPPPTNDVVFTTTKISWGGKRQFQRDVTIDFIIRNDGSPVDIMLSHGSDGSTGGNGQCSVNINKTEYKNEGIKDNNWNSQWFYQCEVNPNEHVPEKTHK